MRLIWYNRDKFSDQDMAQAKAVSDRLLGTKKFIPVALWFFGGTTMQIPITRNPLIPWEDA